jgi:hypothetical protein
MTAYGTIERKDYGFLKWITMNVQKYLGGIMRGVSLRWKLFKSIYLVAITPRSAADLNISSELFLYLRIESMRNSVVREPCGKSCVNQLYI